MSLFTQHFADLPDPRVTRTRRHELLDILAIAICAVIVDADGWDALADYGRLKEAWLRTFLRRPHGIPSADTFGRVFARLAPDTCATRFTAWMQALAGAMQGKLVALDGKTMRHSFDTATGTPALHVVSAWVRENQLTLAQRAVDGHSNEIPAISALLGLIDVRGAIVSLDAMGCQTAIAEAIREGGADYVLTCKANQPATYAALQAFFTHAGTIAFAAIPHTYADDEAYAHGHYERRRVWCATAVDRVALDERWSGLASVACIESTRTAGDVTSVERRYVLSSLRNVDAARIGGLVRGHWGIENQCHWVLDIAFDEDGCRIRKDHGPENFGVLRKLAINLLKRETTVKRGIALKRKHAGWENAYLAKVLTAGVAGK